MVDFQCLRSKKYNRENGEYSQRNGFLDHL